MLDIAQLYGCNSEPTGPDVKSSALPCPLNVHLARSVHLRPPYLWSPGAYRFDASIFLPMWEMRMVCAHKRKCSLCCWLYKESRYAVRESTCWYRVVAHIVTELALITLYQARFKNGLTSRAVKLLALVSFPHSAVSAIFVLPFPCECHRATRT